MENLVQFYILPLTGINYKNFGKLKTNERNLKNVRLNLSSRQLECEVYDINFVTADLWREKNFEKIKKNFKNIIILNIPKQVIKTLTLFKEGKYSHFPSPIKDFIKKYSGLHKDHRYLKALDLDEGLRTSIEKELELEFSLSKTQELLSVPEEDWFLIEEEA